MSARKRKADDDFEYGRSPQHPGSGDLDHSMFPAPQSSPASHSRSLGRPSKKVRSNEVTGRPLALPRLLETLDAHSLRTVLRSICERHPDIGAEVVSTAPRPTIQSALSVLGQYQEKLRAAFPFGGSPGTDYSYNRVKQALTTLIDALVDFTPQYLPPVESQVATSLTYLDGATAFIHELPDWENSQHRYHKDNAYDEISKAWALVISEASKKGGGIQLQYGEWDQKLVKHNQQSCGRMEVAINALGTSLGWMGGSSSTGSGEQSSIRDQLLSGTYGTNLPVRVGPW